MCVLAGMHMPQNPCGDRGQFARVISFLLPYGFWGLSSSVQTGQQAPQPTELSRWLGLLLVENSPEAQTQSKERLPNYCGSRDCIGHLSSEEKFNCFVSEIRIGTHFQPEGKELERMTSAPTSPKSQATLISNWLFIWATLPLQRNKRNLHLTMKIGEVSLRGP